MNNWCSRTVLEYAVYTPNRIGLLNGIILLLLVYFGPMDAYMNVYYTLHRNTTFIYYYNIVVLYIDNKIPQLL